MADYNYPTGLVGADEGLAPGLGWRLVGNTNRAHDEAHIVETDVPGNYHRKPTPPDPLQPEGTLPIPEGFIGRIIWSLTGDGSDDIADEWVGPGTYENLLNMPVLPSGQYPWTIQVRTPAPESAPIPGAVVTILNAAGTAVLWWNIDGDNDGNVPFNLNPGDYSVSVNAGRGYQSEPPTPFTVNGAGSTTVDLVPQALIPSSPPETSRVALSLLRLNGAAEEGVTLEAKLVNINVGLSPGVLSHLKETDVTDAAGMADVVVPLRSSITVGSSKIRFIVRNAAGVIYVDKTVNAPTQSEVWLDDLFDE